MVSRPPSLCSCESVIPHDSECCWPVFFCHGFATLSVHFLLAGSSDRLQHLHRRWMDVMMEPLDRQKQWPPGLSSSLYEKALCFSEKAITPLSVLWKVFCRMLERRVQLLVECQIQMKYPGWSLTRFVTLHRLRDGLYVLQGLEEATWVCQWGCPEVESAGV